MIVSLTSTETVSPRTEYSAGLVGGEDESLVLEGGDEVGEQIDLLHALSHLDIAIEIGQVETGQGCISIDDGLYDSRVDQFADVGWPQCRRAGCRRSSPKEEKSQDILMAMGGK